MFIKVKTAFDTLYINTEYLVFAKINSTVLYLRTYDGETHQVSDKDEVQKLTKLLDSLLYNQTKMMEKIK